MGFDEVRYRREVLDAGLPVPEDLRTRYQLPADLEPAAVGAVVAAVRACWRRHRTRLKYRPVIEELEAGHLLHRPLLEAAAGGDTGPLRAALDTQGRRAREERERLRAALREAAGGLGLLAETTAWDLAAAHRVGPDRVRELLPALGLRIADPDRLPRTPPHPAYGRCAGHLEVLRLRHLADFLAAGAPGGRAERPVRVFDGPGGRPAPPADADAVQAAARRWARLPHGAAHTAAQAVVAAVRVVLAEQGPAGLAQALLYDLAEPLRRRRAARATPATLLDHAVRELSVAEEDARRLVFAVVHETGEDPAVQRLRRLAADGRLTEAAAVADRLPADTLPEEARALAAHVRTRLAEARALVERARRLPPQDSDLAWRLLEQAEETVRDLPQADAVRRGLPVPPATGVTATADATGVTVRWQPSPATTGEPEHTLLRTARRPPRDAGDGTAVRLPLPSPRATSCTDPAPPPCVPLYYAVVVRRAAEPGSAASPPAVCGPVVHRPEVSAVRVRTGDGEVRATWSCPAPARSVEVVRVAADGAEVRVAARRDGFTDRGLTNGETYRYRIRAVYATDGGPPLRTAGVWHTVTPLAPPEPVTDLQFTPVPGAPGSLLVHCPAPAVGALRLYGFEGPPPWPAGTRLPVTELPARPLPVRRDPDGLRLGPLSRPTVVLAVTVADERCVTGAHALACPRPLGPPALSRHGGPGVTAVFDWPDGAGDQAEVVWRTPGADGAERRLVTRDGYRAEAGVRLPVPSGAAVEVEVRPVVVLGGLRAHGPVTRAALPARAEADYRIARGGLPGRRTVTAVFTAPAEAQARRLLLVRSRGSVWPLEPGDGDVLAETGDVTRGPGREVRLSARLPRGPGRWLRCFAEGDGLVLRDPPHRTLEAG
ncbi:hypothetical protein JCM12681A_05830 [Streptomyces mexicanus]